MNLNINTQPSILELEDGKLGYFYSLPQLEEIRHRVLECKDDNLFRARVYEQSYNALMMARRKD